MLAKSTLLGSLSPKLVEELLTIAESVRVHAQDWLFVQGDHADRLYLVLSGRLRVVVEGEDGEEGARVLRVLGPGAAIGELAVLTGQRRSASVQAVRDSELLEVDAGRFHELLERNAELGLGLATALAHQLQDSGGLREVDAAPSVIAVTAVGGVGADRIWHQLDAAFRYLGSTIAVEEAWPGPERSPREDWGSRLAELERDHDHVLLRAGSGSAWRDFCLRQADRVVVVAGDTAPERGDVPAGSDVVFLGVPTPALVASWRAHAAPRVHHVLAAGDDVGDAARRIARRLTGRSLALVLSGGGARAFAHIGVLEVLAEERLPIDRVGGTSMGALLGALVALGWEPERMRETCEREISRRAPFSDYTVPRHALIRARRAESLLRRRFGDSCLEQLSVPLFTVSADLVSARMVVHKTGPLWQAVGSSMAIPGLAPPISQDEQLLIDGGVLNNLPIDVMAVEEAGPILAVDVMRRLTADDLRVPTRAGLPTILETLSRATVLGSVERAEANRRLATLVISPDVQDVSLRDFRHLDRAVQAGRRAAEVALSGGGREALASALTVASERPLTAVVTHA
jgi:NTE family protein